MEFDRLLGTLGLIRTNVLRSVVRGQVQQVHVEIDQVVEAAGMDPKKSSPEAVKLVARQHGKLQAIDSVATEVKNSTGVLIR